MKMEKYDDIINTVWPKETSRPRMPLEQRAKIFLPFAALKGYEESLEDERQIKVQKILLSDEKKNQINEVLKKIYEAKEIKKETQIELTYFINEKNGVEGIYQQIAGAVEKIDLNESFIKVLGEKILFDHIYEINIIGAEK